MKAPDLMGEVLGWRDWQVTAYGDLTSRNTHAVWRPGPNRAICSFGGQEKDHSAPQEDCDCGFYGLHGHDDLSSLERSPYEDYFLMVGTGNRTIHGLFAAWGRLAVHPSGFRSEWAELVSLVHPGPTPPCKRASGYYDVPLFATHDEALTHATDKGYGLVPEEMRPEMPEPDLLLDPPGLVFRGYGPTWQTPSPTYVQPPPFPTPPASWHWQPAQLSGGLTPSPGVGVPLPQPSKPKRRFRFW